MTERKSPPGPREMIQEHQFIHTATGIRFEEETAPSDVPGGGPGSAPEITALVGISDNVRVWKPRGDGR